MNHRLNPALGVYHRVYSQTIFGKPVGRDKMMLIPGFPGNIVILNQNCYWFQQTDNPGDDKYLVTKEVALRILRADVQQRLKKIKVNNDQ